MTVRSRARSRSLGLLGAGTLVLVAFPAAPSQAAAQQPAPAATDSAAPAKPAPKRGGQVVPGIGDTQLCSMLKQAMGNAMRSQGRKKADTAGAQKSPQADTAAQQKAQQADTASPPKAVAKADTAPARAAGDSSARGGGQFVVSVGGRTVNCK